MTKGTAIVLICLIAVIALIIIKIIKDKKSGKNSCACGCKDCQMKEYCHKKEKEE